MGYNLLNYSLIHLFINYDASHSPLLLYGTNQKVSLFESSFSYLTSPVLYVSKFFNINHVLFSNVLNTPIKVGSSQSSEENKLFTSPLVINSAPNLVSTIKRCCFNNTLSRNGNGAIDFNVIIANISIDDCTFYKCISVEKSGVLSYEFLIDYTTHQDINYYSLNITNCCFYNCSTSEGKLGAILFYVSSDLTSSIDSVFSFKNNIAFQCGSNDMNNYISNAYLILSTENIFEASNNNFTQNEGNLFSLKSSSTKPIISETTIVSSKCRSLEDFIYFSKNANVEIRNANILSNNFAGATIFNVADNYVKIENVYFLNNVFLNLIAKYDEKYFSFTKCIFDFTPQNIKLDESNIIIDDGNSTETIKINNKSEDSCFIFTSATKPKVSKSSWITVAVFMVCGIVANILIVVTLVLYLRKRRNQKFLTIAEVPSGYDQIYDNVV